MLDLGYQGCRATLNLIVSIVAFSKLKTGC